MKRLALLFALLPALLGAAACSHSARPAQAAPAPAADTLTSAPGLELPLPTVPSTLTDPAARAGYIAAHFWDGLNFADTLRSHSRDFMEQNFANYVSVLRLANLEEMRPAVASLVRCAEADSAACELLGDVADKYLYDPNSPMLSEPLYELFLAPLLESPCIDVTKKLRLTEQRASIALNRPGTLAADFTYEGRDGSRLTLRRTPSAPRMLLVFFDPDCEHCAEIMKAYAQEPLLARLIADGRLTLLAVYADGDRSLWQKALAEMPQAWQLGFDLTGVQEQGLYNLRAMPSIYVLDADKRVLLKDVQPEAALDFLSR